MTSYAPSLKLKAAAELERRRRMLVASRPPVLPACEWVSTHATIVHPQRGRIPFQPYPYQADFLRAYDHPRRIILKARQVGISQVFALEALYAAITVPETLILLVSRSQDLAVNLLRYCYLTYNILRDPPVLAKENESEIGFVNGSRIKSIPANRSTGRGFAASTVYLDEFAYAAYDNEIYQSISPTISHGGRLVVASTPDGANNLFHDLYVAGEGFARFTVPWHHCPAYYTDAERAAGLRPEQSAWYLRERSKYTAQQWASEFECDFAGSGDMVFHAADIDAAEDGAIGEGAPQPGRAYLTTVDVGRRQDATVINVIDRTGEPYQRVYHDRIERVPYPVIQQRIAETWRRYGGTLVVESNGVGDPVIENLDAPAVPFVTSVRSKTQAIQSLQLLLEHKRLKARWTQQERRELMNYQLDDRAITQDCVMSLAIAAAQLEVPEVRIRWL